MKKLIFLVAILLGIGFTSCDKSKTCNCKTTIDYSGLDEETAEFLQGMGGSAETTVTIEKGKCSDGDSRVASDMGGVSVTQVTTCTEQ